MPHRGLKHFVIMITLTPTAPWEMLWLQTIKTGTDNEGNLSLLNNASLISHGLLIMLHRVVTVFSSNGSLVWWLPMAVFRRKTFDSAGLHQKISRNLHQRGSYWMGYLNSRMRVA